MSRRRVAKKNEQYYSGVKASFTVDLPDLKFFTYLFLVPCMEKHKTGILLHRHPKVFNFECKNRNVTKKKDRILIKDLINYKLKY